MGTFDTELQEFQAQRTQGFEAELREFEQLRTEGPTPPPDARQTNSSNRRGMLPTEDGKLPGLPDAGLPEGSTPQSDGINTKREGTRVADPAAGRNLLEEADVFVRGAVKGIPVAGPLLDRGATALQATTEGVPTEDVQARQRAADTRNPGTQLSGEVVGSLVGYGLLAAKAPALVGANAASFAGRAAVGGGSAAVIEFADQLARGNSLEQAEQGGLRAGVVGAVLTPVLMKYATRIAQVGQRNPTVEAMEAHARSLYTQADNSGIGISHRAFQTLSSNIDDGLRGANFSPRLIPEPLRAVHRAIDDVAAGGRAVPLQRLELLRQELVPLTRGVTPELAQQRRMARNMLDQVDDFATRLGSKGYPVSVAQQVNMTPVQQQQLLTQARNTWRQLNNVNRVDAAVQAAETHASGIATGIRSEFAKLARDRKFMAGLNDAEKFAVRSMASQSNFNRPINILAKMDPRRSNLRLMSIFGVGLGAAAGGAGGGIGVIATGMMATGAANRSMLRRASQARATLSGQNPNNGTAFRKVAGTAAQLLAGK